MSTADLYIHDLGAVIVALKTGRKAQRQGWNGKGMYIAIQRPEPGTMMTQPYVYLFTSDAHYIPWTCSQADLLATDWYIF